MKTALGYLAVVASLAVLGGVAYNGHFGSWISRQIGHTEQERADLSAKVKNDNAKSAAAFATTSKVEAVAAGKAVQVAEEPVKKVRADQPGTKEMAVPDARKPVIDVAENSVAEEQTSSEKSGVIETAVEAVKTALSKTEPSSVAWPVVSEDEFNKQREARLAMQKSVPSPDAATKTGAEVAKSSAPTSGQKMTPYERAKSTEVGTLKNPYDYKDKAIIEEGKKTYLKYSCNGCHGGGGGGGMCPPLTNETWVYGGDDDTLYRLITLGTDELGRERKGQEVVVGPMPPYKDIIKDEDQLWKIIAYIRSKWGGREKKIEW